MRELTSAEIHALIEELRPKIEDGFIRKFYEVGENAFRFSFYTSETKNTMVYCKLLSTFNETMLSESVGEPSPFTMGIRKRLESAKVIGITQHATDRIIILGISTKEEKYKLIIEMFGKGNMILVNQAGVTELCYRRVIYKDRQVAAKLPYQFPHPTGIDFWTASNKEILDAVDGVRNKGKAMSELSKSINMGPLYLENLFNISGLDPKGRISTQEQAALLAENISRFVKEIRGPEPKMYKSHDNKIVDFAILPIRKYEEQSALETQRFSTISEMLDEIHTEERSTIKSESNAQRVAELTSNVKKQEELAAQLKIESEQDQRAGHKLLENMDAVNALIQYLQQNKRATMEELKERFKELKVKELDLKNKTVKIELEV